MDGPLSTIPEQVPQNGLYVQRRQHGGDSYGGSYTSYQDGATLLPVRKSAPHNVFDVPTNILLEHLTQPSPVDLRGTCGCILLCKVGCHREGDRRATPLPGECD